MHKKLLVLFTLFISIILIGGACEGLPEDQQVDYEEDVKPLIEEIDTKYQVRGSCNVIAEKSTCVDYVGSYWDNSDLKKLNCKGVGVYSDNTCPYTDVGGCQSSGGTMFEMIVWHYDYGGEAFDPEEAMYAAGACNAIPTTKWVTPDEVFLTH